MFKGFATIAYVGMGKMTPTLRKLNGESAPFTKGDTNEAKYRDRRAAVDYKGSKK